MSHYTYYVKKVSPCPECRGEGMYQHPLWAQFWAEHGRTVEDIQQIHDPESANEAWDRLMERVFPNWKTVPEEVSCDVCNGEGVIEDWTPLQEALEALEDLSVRK